MTKIITALMLLMLGSLALAQEPPNFPLRDRDRGEWREDHNERCRERWRDWREDVRRCEQRRDPDRCRRRMEDSRPRCQMR
jgi:hypothetical protein